MGKLLCTCILKHMWCASTWWRENGEGRCWQVPTFTLNQGKERVVERKICFQRERMNKFKLLHAHIPVYEDLYRRFFSTIFFEKVKFFRRSSKFVYQVDRVGRDVHLVKFSTNISCRTPSPPHSTVHRYISFHEHVLMLPLIWFGLSSEPHSIDNYSHCCDSLKHIYHDL